MNIIATKFFVFIFISLLSGCFEDKSRMMVDGKLEPPAPDSSENDKTIGGIDLNEDGVRDDIERWINREFPGEENYNKRVAWKQYAKSTRDIQINSEDEEALNKYFYEWNDASVCALYIYMELKERHEEKIRFSDELIGESNDTKPRMKAWSKADLSFAGKAHALPRHGTLHKTCKFKIKQ